MKRKKGILLSAMLETLSLALLVVLFFEEIISFNLFLALSLVVGVVFSAAVVFIIRNTQI